MSGVKGKFGNFLLTCIWVSVIAISFFHCNSRYVGDYTKYHSPFYIDSSNIGGIKFEYSYYDPNGDWGDAKYENVKQSVWFINKENPIHISSKILQSDLPEPSSVSTLFIGGKLFYSTLSSGGVDEIWVYDTLTGVNKRFSGGRKICCASSTGKHIVIQKPRDDSYDLYDVSTKEILKNFTYRNEPILFSGDTAVVLRSEFEPYTIAIENFRTGQKDTLSNNLRILPFKLTSQHDFALVIKNSNYYIFRVLKKEIDTTRIGLSVNDLPDYNFPESTGDLDKEGLNLVRAGISNMETLGCIYEVPLSRDSIKTIICNEKENDE